MLGILGGVMLAMIFLKILGSIDTLEKDVKNMQQDFEVLKTERDYYKSELDIHKTWTDFLPKTEGGDGVVLDKEPKESKYNSDDIPGLFDAVFEEDKK